MSASHNKITPTSQKYAAKFQGLVRQLQSKTKAPPQPGSMAMPVIIEDSPDVYSQWTSSHIS